VVTDHQLTPSSWANPGAAALFYSHVHLHGGPAPVRRFLPQLIDLIWSRQIDPGKVFDLSLPLEQAAEGYRAMDERHAIKTLLRVPTLP
jgi:threonine dehydrogenase-like Zn-dependent dehydrogenase